MTLADTSWNWTVQVSLKHFSFYSTHMSKTVLIFYALPFFFMIYPANFTQWMGVQFQKLRSSELDRFCLNGLSQLGDEERILTTISLKSILFNKYVVWNTNYSNMYKTENNLPKFLTIFTLRRSRVLKLEISLSFDKKYFARYHFRFVIFSLF